MINKDGSFYQGQFKRGKPDRKGLKVLRNGKVIFGIWRAGKLDSDAKTITKSGESYDG